MQLERVILQFTHYYNLPHEISLISDSIPFSKRTIEAVESVKKALEYSLRSMDSVSYSKCHPIIYKCSFIVL